MSEREDTPRPDGDANEDASANGEGAEEKSDNRKGHDDGGTPPGVSIDPEQIQKQLGDFFRDKFGGEVFTVPMDFNMGDLNKGAGTEARSAQAEDGGEEDSAAEERVSSALSFDRTPREVKDYLDRFVIGQNEAKRALAVAVCDHYNHVRALREETDERIDYVKQNVILLGPTGVGKTYLIRTLANLIGVPFVKADITKFSETGYIGNDVDDLVRDLVRAADGDIELAEYGIVFVDEVDKIASSGNMVGRDVSGRGVQTGLLKLLEDTEVQARSPHDITAQLQDMMQMRRGGTASKSTINTRHILFVVSGAFSGLDEIIEKRLSERNIGFSSQRSAASDAETPLAQVTTADFVEYGFEPEFIGRLPIRVSLNKLGDDDLFEILTTSEGSILKQYVHNFRGYGIDLHFDRQALATIAQRAREEKTGARGLMTVLESTLRPFKFHLPGSEIGVLAVTDELVAHPERALRELLENPEKATEHAAIVEVRQFQDEFEASEGVRLELDDAAVTMAKTIAAELQISITEYLENTFANHRQFLASVREKTGETIFPVTPQVLNRPEDGVRAWLEA